MRSKAVHNLTVLNHGMHDPALTPHGENQCLELQSKFPYHESVDLLVCSPLQRTIQTTLLAFEPELSRGVQCIALPEVQETSDLPCDTGSNVATLKEKFKNKPVDLSLLSEDWDSKTGKWAPRQEAIERRCRDARKWLKTRDGKAIVVVTHGGLLHYLTEDWAGCEIVPGNGNPPHSFRCRGPHPFRKALTRTTQVARVPDGRTPSSAPTALWMETIRTHRSRRPQSLDNGEETRTSP